MLTIKVTANNGTPEALAKEMCDLAAKLGVGVEAVFENPNSPANPIPVSAGPTSKPEELLRHYNYFLNPLR